MNISEKRVKFSQALIADRLSKGISQRDLAFDLKVVQQSLSKWESATTLPRDYRIKQIANYFGPNSQTAFLVDILLHEKMQKPVINTNFKNEAQSFSFETKNFPLRIFNSLKILSELQSAMETTINDIRQELKSLAKSSSSERE